MRPKDVLAAALLGAPLVSGCDLLGPGSIDRAVVTAVRIEALPLDVRWDATLAGENPPDVYLDVHGPGALFRPLVRTDVAENVTAAQLPLALPLLDDALPLPVDEAVRLSVADRDAGFPDTDDELFAVDSLVLASRVRGDRPGDTATLTFEDGRTRVRLTVRWE